MWHPPPEQRKWNVVVFLRDNPVFLALTCCHWTRTSAVKGIVHLVLSVHPPPEGVTCRGLRGEPWCSRSNTMEVNGDRGFQRETQQKETQQASILLLWCPPSVPECPRARQSHSTLNSIIHTKFWAWMSLWPSPMGGRDEVTGNSLEVPGASLTWSRGRGSSGQTTFRFKTFQQSNRIYFNCIGFCWNKVYTWNSRRVLWTQTLQPPPPPAT